MVLTEPWAESEDCVVKAWNSILCGLWNHFHYSVVIVSLVLQPNKTDNLVDLTHSWKTSSSYEEIINFIILNFIFF